MATETTVSPAEQARQNIRNLALLARQAIGNDMDSMTANPTMVASACAEYERAMSGDLGKLTAELAAAKSNIASLSGQIETRYREGVRAGVLETEVPARKLAEAAIRIARKNPTYNEAQILTEAAASIT